MLSAAISAGSLGLSILGGSLALIRAMAGPLSRKSRGKIRYGFNRVHRAEETPARENSERPYGQRSETMESEVDAALQLRFWGHFCDALRNLAMSLVVGTIGAEKGDTDGCPLLWRIM
jgi:hypothetical protein